MLRSFTYCGHYHFSFLFLFLYSLLCSWFLLLLLLLLLLFWAHTIFLSNLIVENLLLRIFFIIMMIIRCSGMFRNFTGRFGNVPRSGFYPRPCLTTTSPSVEKNLRDLWIRPSCENFIWGLIKVQCTCAPITCYIINPFRQNVCSGFQVLVKNLSHGPSSLYWVRRDRKQKTVLAAGDLKKKLTNFRIS